MYLDDDDADLILGDLLSFPLLLFLLFLASFYYACYYLIDTSKNGNDSNIVLHFVTPMNVACSFLVQLLLSVSVFFFGASSHFIFILCPKHLMCYIFKTLLRVDVCFYTQM